MSVARFSWVPNLYNIHFLIENQGSQPDPVNSHPVLLFIYNFRIIYLYIYIYVNIKKKHTHTYIYIYIYMIIYIYYPIPFSPLKIRNLKINGWVVGVGWYLSCLDGLMPGYLHGVLLLVLSFSDVCCWHLNTVKGSEGNYQYKKRNFREKKQRKEELLNYLIRQTLSLCVFNIQPGMQRHMDFLSISANLSLENTETAAEVLLLAVYHTVISLQNLTTNEHVPNLMHQTLTPSNVEMTWKWWVPKGSKGKRPNHGIQILWGQELLQGRPKPIWLWRARSSMDDTPCQKMLPEFAGWPLKLFPTFEVNECKWWDCGGLSSCLFGLKHIPYAPCIVYLPT